MKTSRLTGLAVAAAVMLCFGGGLSMAAQTGVAPKPVSSAAAAPASAPTAAPMPRQKPDATQSVSAEPAAPKAHAASKPAGGGAAHVYLMRGLFNIFSLGMDDLAAKIQAAGVSASVHNHSEWRELSDEIAARYKAGNHGPIILIGHSLGADAVMLMGEYLGTLGVPVALIVPFDGTRSLSASGNVGIVMNITQRDYAYMRRGYGFRGELANIDVSKDESIGHISIDKAARLHAMVVNKVVAVARRGGGPIQTAAPSNTPAIPPSSKPVSAPAPESAPANPGSPKQAPVAAAFEQLESVRPAMRAPTSAAAKIDSTAGSSATARAPAATGAAASPPTSLEYQRLGQ
jgi:hypothetical protein